MKEVTLVEARTVDNLGAGAPDTPQFIEAVREELGIKKASIERLSFFGRNDKT